MRRALAMLLVIGAACAAPNAARPGATAPARATPDASDVDAGFLARMLQPLADAIAAEGYRTRGELERGFLAPSARVVQPLVIEPRSCLAVVAIATATVTDLDTAIYAADGSVLAEDDGSGSRPVVRLCSGERRMEAYLSFYAFQGTGSFAALRLSRPLEPADVLGLAEAERAARDGDGPAFSEVLRGLRGRGYQDDGPITEVPLAPGSAVRLVSRVQAGRCYGVVADGQRLRVRLLDREGREVALGIGAYGPAALQYCAREDAELLLELSSEGAERSARLARLHAEQAQVGSARATFLGEPSAAAASGARKAKQPEGRCAGKPGALLEEGALSQGAVIERELKLVGCERIEVELRGGLALVTVRVESARGELIAEQDVLAPQGALRACAATASGGVTLSAFARAGFGVLRVRRQACDD